MTSDAVNRRRIIGETWERNFCALAASYGKEFTPHQLARADGAACSWWRETDGTWHKQLLPDVVIWSAPGEHHEIKHKDQMRNGCYGYEAYRLRELVRFARTTGQNVFYTIHDWRHAGAATSAEPVPNRIADWFCASVAVLSRSHTAEYWGPSIVNNTMKDDVLQFRWDAVKYFRPLAEVWNVISTQPGDGIT
jgi:hypothetical protein